MDYKSRVFLKSNMVSVTAQYGTMIDSSHSFLPAMKALSWLTTVMDRHS